MISFQLSLSAYGTGYGSPFVLLFLNFFCLLNTQGKTRCNAKYRQLSSLTLCIIPAE